MQLKTVKDQDRSDFLDALHEKGVGKTREETELVWRWCCEHALDWLVNKERPVDMHFIKLRLTAFRPEWCMSVLRSMFRLNQTTKAFTGDSQYRKAYLRRTLRDPRLLFMDTGICQRFVEVEHLPLWLKLVRYVELRRHQILGEHGYAKSIIELLQRHAKHAEYQFRKFLALHATPCARIKYRLPDGEPVLAPAMPMELGIFSGKRLNTRFEFVDFSSKQNPSRDAIRLRHAAKSLSSVRTLQPQTPDVRDGRGDVSGSADQPL